MIFTLTQHKITYYLAQKMGVFINSSSTSTQQFNYPGYKLLFSLDSHQNNLISENSETRDTVSISVSLRLFDFLRQKAKLRRTG